MTNLGSDSNRVNLHFFWCDICQRKEKEVKTDWDLYWLISLTVTAFVLVLRLNSWAKSCNLFEFYGKVLYPKSEEALDLPRFSLNLGWKGHIYTFSIQNRNLIQKFAVIEISMHSTVKHLQQETLIFLFSLSFLVKCILTD